MSYLTEDTGIASVRASGTGRARDAAQYVSVALSFADGSIGQLLYTARGSPLVDNEHLEVHDGGMSAVLKDLPDLHTQPRTQDDQGEGVRQGRPRGASGAHGGGAGGGGRPMPADVLLRVTRTTFLLHQALES